MRVTLRNCDNDALLDATYTFPRGSVSSSSGSGSGSSGGIEIINAEYLDEINQQQLDSITYGGNGEVNTGLGFGNVNNELGYYSFRVLPNYLPGNFYVVFEAPEGYRLTSGSGEYWEVQEAGLNDVVQPVLEAAWNNKKSSSSGNDDSNTRYLQENNGNDADDNDSNNNNNNNNNNTAITNSNFTIPIIPGTPDTIKLDPINHSGYYARSKGCIYIKESPTTISNINYGLTKDSWPLHSFQYASFVIIIEFFAPARRRGLQINSLECRKYQKLKGEGVDIEDIWGCETPLDTGGGKQFDFADLNIEQGDLITNTLKDFLVSRASRVWSIRSVHLAWQDVIEFDTDNNDGSSQNQQLAQLELGIRIRAEFQNDKAKVQDLADVIMGSIDANPTTLLSTMKANVNVMPPFFRLAGGLTMRRRMWKPTTPPPTPVPRVDVLRPVDTSQEVDPPTPPVSQGIGGGQLLMIIGIVVGVGVVPIFLAIAAGVYVWRTRVLQQQDERPRRPGMQKQKGSRLNIDEDDYNDDSSDSLSSRWYSDYEGSDRSDDDESDFAAEDSFGDFDDTGPPNLNNMRESMRQSVKSSAQNSSTRSSFQGQRSSGQRASMRGSMRDSTRSSARSSVRSSARSSMNSGAPPIV